MAVLLTEGIISGSENSFTFSWLKNITFYSFSCGLNETLEKAEFLLNLRATFAFSFSFSPSLPPNGLWIVLLQKLL